MYLNEHLTKKNLSKYFHEQKKTPISYWIEIDILNCKSGAILRW